MRIFLKSLLLFASIFAAAYMARILIVPNVVPIAEGEQPNWQIRFAFILTSVQIIGSIGIALVILAAPVNQLKSLVHDKFSVKIEATKD